jgi:fucose permease
MAFIFTASESTSPSENEASSVLGEIPPKLNFAILGAMFFLYVAIEASIGGWIATLARRIAIDAPGRWVFAPSLFWAGLLLGRGLAPLLLSRTRERLVAIAGLVVSAVGMFVLVLATHWQSIAAAGFVAGLGLAAVYPITIALLSRFGGAETRSAGPMFALGGLGGTIMPWMVGVVSTWSGSLQKALLVPLLATAILLSLHVIGNHGSQTTEASALAKQ